jgi:sugar phosphate isomerase/epimerase
MSVRELEPRLGLNVPYGWWPAAPLLKSFEAAGCGWTQIPAPPAEVLLSPRECTRHGRSAEAALATTGMAAVVHAPDRLQAGTPAADRVFEGLLSYAAETGARQVVYHARNFPDSPASEDRQLAETRSLARLAVAAERLGLVIALENLAPVFPGPERLGHTPLLLRSLAQRISSPALGLCLDLGHAHVVADLRHADLTELVPPVLDSVTVFHLHDNLGARRHVASPPELDPLRLDLHLPPGRGTLPWSRVAALLRAHTAPLLLEVHPPHRPAPGDLIAESARVLGLEQRAVPATA